MKILFWISIFGILYTYLGYILILIVIGLFKNRVKREIDYSPTVTMIISCYNEEKALKSKIENSLSLDYPKDKMEIIIVSDASTDQTDIIAEQYVSRGIKLIRQDKRAGKTAAQNLAVSHAHGEILVFSDATTVYDQKAIRNLVRNFSDPSVGCVGGKEQFLNPQNGQITREVSFFWKYEQFLREQESRSFSLIGVSGCIFAIRKVLYQPLDETLIEDFALALKIVSAGYRVYYEKEAIGYEDAVINSEQEFRRKSRIVAGGLNVLWNQRYLLNPLRFPMLSFQLISHKLMRWCVPLFLISLFVSNIALHSNIRYFIFSLLQIIFYFCAVLGHFKRRSRYNSRFVKLAYHFCLMNLSVFYGFIKFFREERKPIWQPIR